MYWKYLVSIPKIFSSDLPSFSHSRSATYGLPTGILGIPETCNTYTCPTASMDFLALDDFLNAAKSCLNNFIFKVLVAFFCHMGGLYIVFIIKACRI